MVDTTFRAALAARYDGPLPVSAAVPHDWALSRRAQIANRKRWAWREVRRLGHEMASARRALRATGAIEDRRAWAQARGSLAHALSTWACFRDWLKCLEAADRHRPLSSEMHR